MCGIVGARHEWLLQRNLAPAAAVRAATAAVGWRGPDGQHWLRAGGWWLGAARLAITQRHSRQPVVRRGGRYAGVLNGAITNARALLNRLLPGAELRREPPNDAWLPLLAVANADAAALRELAGHHAYAVVDTATDELVFGQDRFGEKPFFCLVGRLDGRDALLAFASTPAALRELGMPPFRPRRRLAEWFRFGWAPMLPHRFSARLRLEAVPPGGPQTTRTRTTWCRSWGEAPGRSAPIAPANRRAAADVRRTILANVAQCIDTSVPVALSLSGGIDSSCLALALRELGCRAPAYQALVAGNVPHERRAAAAVAALAGLPMRLVDLGPEVSAHLPRLTALAGQPLGDPSLLAVHALARAAAADGVRVLLSGEGADELFLGYRRYRALAWLPHLPWLHRLTPRWSMRYLARSWRAVVAEDPAVALLCVTPPAFAETVLTRELAQRRAVRAAASQAATRRSGRQRALAARRADFGGYLRHDLLPKIDIACMAAGVEGRCPYLIDADVDDASWPALGKRRLRAAFAAQLPRTARRLPKHGFALPLDRWFRGDLPWLDLLAEPRTRQREHLRPGGIQRVVDLHRRGGVNLGHGLYLLVACEVFLRTLDRPAAGPASAGAKPVQKIIGLESTGQEDEP
jgi:asparagine synthase (glutamine-hydrolysing)